MGGTWEKRKSKPTRKNEPRESELANNINDKMKNN
jgi:hypothetical protein